MASLFFKKGNVCEHVLSHKLVKDGVKCELGPWDGGGVYFSMPTEKAEAFIKDEAWIEEVRKFASKFKGQKIAKTREADFCIIETIRGLRSGKAFKFQAEVFEKFPEVKGQFETLEKWRSKFTVNLHNPDGFIRVYWYSEDLGLPEASSIKAEIKKDGYNTDYRFEPSQPISGKLADQIGDVLSSVIKQYSL